VALIEEPSTKAEAIGKCKSKSADSGHLVIPRTSFQQMKLEQFLSKRNFTDGEFFLGMTKVQNQWLWDDGSPVFVQCNYFIFKYFIVSLGG
jgi:hypothetical protein